MVQSLFAARVFAARVFAAKLFSPKPSDFFPVRRVFIFGAEI